MSSKFEEWRVKELLSALEAANTPFKQVCFKSICDKNPGAFGDSASSTRMFFQKRFSNYKCMKIGNYKEILDYHNIPTSLSNLQLLSQETDTDPKDFPIKGSDSNNSEFISSSNLSEASIGTPQRKKPTATKENELIQSF
eukprot:3405440-Ditylum_brightwellii.AAC.1